MPTITWNTVREALAALAVGDADAIGCDCCDTVVPADFADAGGDRYYGDALVAFPAVCEVCQVTGRPYGPRITPEALLADLLGQVG